MTKALAVVVMAAGKGTRMKNPDKAKVMYPIHGRPMIDYVVDLALRVQSARTVIIVGWQKDTVVAHLQKQAPSVRWVEQNPQLGTGHAVMQAEPALKDFTGDVLVLSGDVPMLSYRTVSALISEHQSHHAAATVLTTALEDSTGYGRILRDGEGAVVGIIEHKDATEEQRTIREINTGIYVFDKARLFEGLQHITPDNAQKEYYLTDVFKYFWRNAIPVRAVKTENPKEVQGINTLQQLEEAQGMMKRKSEL
jgi:UDP-N-acetylglucosamine pyrophosphorylase